MFPTLWQAALDFQNNCQVGGEPGAKGSFGRINSEIAWIREILFFKYANSGTGLSDG